MGINKTMISWINAAQKEKPSLFFPKQEQAPGCTVAMVAIIVGVAVGGEEWTTEGTRLLLTMRGNCLGFYKKTRTPHTN